MYSIFDNYTDNRMLYINNTKNNSMTPRILFAIIVFIFCIIALFTFKDYGTTWDEQLQYTYGEFVIRWYETFFEDKSATTFRNLIYYGGLFDVVANIFIRATEFGAYETRHLVNAAFGLIGIVATWRIGVLVSGHAAGIVAAILLLVTPAYYGHSFNNPKDIPFAALATLAVYFILRSSRDVPRVPVAMCLKVGLALGAALAIRVGGGFLIGYLVLFWGGRVLWTRPFKENWFHQSKLFFGRALLVILFAWPVMLMFWPWAQQSPLLRPIEAFFVAARFPWEGEMLFRGENVSSLNLPWDYLPTWFLITLPEAYFVGFLVGGIALSRRLTRRESIDRDTSADLFSLLFSVGFPFVAVISLHSVLYDAHRQFLFIFPLLSVLSAWGLVAFLRDCRFSLIYRLVPVMLVTASLLLTITDMVRLHPYQTVFFNRLFAGGLEKADKLYETDYWGASYREGIEVLIQNYRPNNFLPIKVANCAEPFQINYWLMKNPEARRRFITVHCSQNPDILLATKRYQCLDDPGRPIHAIKRLDVPLLYIYERNQRGKWMDIESE
jgi:hypothetical protein